MIKRNKKWVKPQLIVLVRRREEEAVLTICKYGEMTTVSSQLSINSCQLPCAQFCDVGSAS